jgi:hypothetical protein
MTGPNGVQAGAEEPIATSLIVMWVDHYPQGRVMIRFHVSPPLGGEPGNVALLLRQQADQLDFPKIVRPG